jgi:two-component system cell cycle sensor histidine kinase/response regulator CckA
MSNGYKVLDTADGAEALRVSAAYDGPIHMMVTDLIMPEMAGHEVAERLSLERPNMQVIYMSGCLDSDILQEKNLKHAVPYIQKPFSLNTLGDTIREVLAAQEGGPSPRK